ncbi:MAG TPA: diaminopimelate epimerase [Lachnospiraceae bacterium]|nr:diaminopimelate epimerase [Lachnospiraceae bacterium]
MKFTKMHGCGNDYIYINELTQPVTENKVEIVKRLCHRHFGIGGDGVIFIKESKIADFEMEMYNVDGTRAEMCGNGIRCVGKYVYEYDLTDKNMITIESFGKIKTLYMYVEKERRKVSTIIVDMGSPILFGNNIPVLSQNGELLAKKVIDSAITIEGIIYKMTCVSMGNPHAVVFVKDVDEVPVKEIGPLFENHKRFPNRTNVEFVQVIDRRTIKMRVWERGSGETLACGTGSCAAVVACVLNNDTDNKVQVNLRGGTLQVEWDRQGNLVFLSGGADVVFDGEIALYNDSIDESITYC